jgi:23S rRNA pseudouridine955/2504/2580 synthase/23S rRNA pseudouridine1911/1915/1917 synthase
MKRPPPYTIVHLDEAIVAVNKSPGILSVPGRGHSESVVGLLAVDPKLAGDKPLLVHRIDADTSGMLLLARTPQAQKHLGGQFALRTITKEYLALVRGTPLDDAGTVDLPIGHDRHDKERMVIRGIDAKPARTRWAVETRYAGVTLLRVYPVSGRRHQVRVHLKAMGYPLAVDPLYGGEHLLLSEFKRKFKLGKLQDERPLMARLTLHAHRLTFSHPLTDAPTTLTAELPKDFRSTLTALDRWAPYTL